MPDRAPAPLDTAAIKDDQRAHWNASSPGWKAVSADFERGANTVTTRLFELAGLREGQRVLDIATGHGEPALSAAHVVGPSGHVVGTDISPRMLDAARRRAGELPNVEFVEADVEDLRQPAGSFDVALSRFGLMFAVDHVATFRGLARVLVPGGVLAVAVWGPQPTHLISLARQALTERLALPEPEPGTPGPYSMSDAEVLRAELSAAGFAEISVREQVVPFTFADVPEYVRHIRLAIPPEALRAMRDRLDSDDDAFAEILVDSVTDHVADDGTLSLPSTALVIRARRPGGSD